MLAVSDAVIIIGISLFIKLPGGKFSISHLGRSTLSAWPALLMPVCVLGGLYGGVFTPTEAGAAAAGYSLIFGIVNSSDKSTRSKVIQFSIGGAIGTAGLLMFGDLASYGSLLPVLFGFFIVSGAVVCAVIHTFFAVTTNNNAFFKELLPTTQRTINLTAIVYFLLGCVGVFQFLLANKGWPQHVAAWVTDQGFSQMEFLAVLLVVMLFLSMFLTGVAILVLTVPIFFPVALTLQVDPIHLGILAAIAIEMGGVIPPVGLNLFAVSGTTGVPVTKVMKGAIPFLITDGIVLILMLFFPILCLWLPQLLVQSHFN